MHLGELRPGDLLTTAYHEPALVEQVDRYGTPTLDPPGDRELVRLHLTTTDGSRSWATAWMPADGRIQGQVHRLGGA